MREAALSLAMIALFLMLAAIFVIPLALPRRQFGKAVDEMVSVGGLSIVALIIAIIFMV